MIGLGTRQFGSRKWNYGSGHAQNMVRQILERANELGVNLINTTETYGFGASAKIFGAAPGSQASVFLATSFLPLCHRSAHIEKRLRVTCKRFGVESIDLYQLNGLNPLANLGEIGLRLENLYDQGAIRSVGVRNFSVARWESFERSLSIPVFSNQIHYSLLSRKPELEQLPFALARGRVIIASSPLEGGVLATRYDSGNLPKDIPRLNRHSSIDALERMQPLLASLSKIAKSQGASMAQIALAWTISHPNVAVAPNASSVSQLEANVRAASLILTAAEIAELNAASELYRASTGNRLLRSIRTRAGI